MGGSTQAGCGSGSASLIEINYTLPSFHCRNGAGTAYGEGVWKAFSVCLKSTQEAQRAVEIATVIRGLFKSRQPMGRRDVATKRQSERVKICPTFIAVSSSGLNAQLFEKGEWGVGLSTHSIRANQRFRSVSTSSCSASECIIRFSRLFPNTITTKCGTASWDAAGVLQRLSKH